MGKSLQLSGHIRALAFAFVIPEFTWWVFIFYILQRDNALTYVAASVRPLIPKKEGVWRKLRFTACRVC
jgi:hypothetical protein